MKQLPALNWIIEFIESNSIPYVVCGGLAAKVYGSKRKLNDIDLYVPDEYFASIVKFGKPYITYGPTHHKGNQWDLTYVQFNYLGQEVEVGSDKDCKIFDSLQARWSVQHIDFENWERREIYGVELRIMEKNDLVAYKKKLNREVDLEDIAQISDNVL